MNECSLCVITTCGKHKHNILSQLRTNKKPSLEVMLGVTELVYKRIVTPVSSWLIVYVWMHGHWFMYSSKHSLVKWNIADHW